MVECVPVLDTIEVEHKCKKRRWGDPSLYDNDMWGHTRKRRKN